MRAGGPAKVESGDRRPSGLGLGGRRLAGPARARARARYLSREAGRAREAGGPSTEAGREDQPRGSDWVRRRGGAAGERCTGLCRGRQGDAETQKARWLSQAWEDYHGSRAREDHQRLAARRTIMGGWPSVGYEGRAFCVVRNLYTCVTTWRWAKVKGRELLIVEVAGPTAERRRRRSGMRRSDGNVAVLGRKGPAASGAARTETMCARACGRSSRPSRPCRSRAPPPSAAPPPSSPACARASAAVSQRCGAGSGAPTAGR